MHWCTLVYAQVGRVVIHEHFNAVGRLPIADQRRHLVVLVEIAALSLDDLEPRRWLLAVGGDEVRFDLLAALTVVQVQKLDTLVAASDLLRTVLTLRLLADIVYIVDFSDHTFTLGRQPLCPLTTRCSECAGLEATHSTGCLLLI